MKKTVVDAVAHGVSAGRIINNIALVVDRSASMSLVREAARALINDQILTVKQQAHDLGQETRFSLYYFNDEVKTVYRARDARQIDPQTGYTPDGNTALNDAVNQATKDFDADKTFSRKPGEEHAYLILTITDGEENASKWGGLRLTNAEDFSYVFLVPPGYRAKSYLQTLGVPVRNIREWAQTKAGTEEASRVSSEGLRGYYTARQSGAKRTESFFTDLSHVKARDLAKLDDVTSAYRQWQVDVGEVQIADFVRGKGVEYRIGRAFYELTKPERVQAHKEVILLNRKTKRLLGGEEAKALVGITGGAGVTVKVTPGNHADFKVFINSTSMNRKLVRGTSVLYPR